MPDEEIFGDHELSYDTLLKRIRELAYLNGGLQINFRDDRNKKKEVFKFEEGIKEFVKHRSYTDLLKKIGISIILNTEVGLMGAGSFID